MGAPAPFGVVEIRAEHDVASELKLAPPMLHMLGKLGAIGGEMPFSWDVFQTRIANAKTPDEVATVRTAREAVIDLINGQYIREVEILVGFARQPRLILRLTDKGRAVLSELEKFRLVPGSVTPLSESELAEEIRK